MKITKFYYGGTLTGKKFPLKPSRKALIAAIALHLSLLNSNIALAGLPLNVNRTEVLYAIDNTIFTSITQMGTVVARAGNSNTGFRKDYVPGDSGSNHNLSITGGTFEAVAGGLTSGNAINNVITITNNAKINTEIFGGYGDAAAYNNAVTISDSHSAAVNIYGGNSDHGKVSGNNVTVSNSTVGSVYGGYSQISGETSGNNVTVSDSTVRFDICGGYSAVGKASGNNVTVSDSTVHFDIYGGKNYLDDSEEVSGNNVTIKNNSTVRDIYGGSSATGATSSNTVTISNSTVDDIYGSYSTSGAVSNNTVTISNSTADNIYGGKSKDGAVFGNSVTISNSTADNIYGGRSESRDASDNTVNLVSVNGGFANVNNDVYLSCLYINKNYISLTKPNQGNGSLNIYGSGHKIGGNLYANNATVKFYIPANASGLTTDGSNTMLTVGDTADVSNSKLVTYLYNVGNIPRGNSSITLLKANTLKAANLLTDTAVGTDGLMNVDLQVDVGNNEITAHANTSIPKSAGNAKSPVETQISSISLINSGSDMIAGRSFGDAAAAIASSNTNSNTGGTGEANGTNGDGSTGNSASGITPFASMGGSNIRQKSGSYVDTNAWNISAGFAREVQTKKGRLLFGPIIEYGSGSYESHLDNGTVGNGNSSFWGIGGIIKHSYDDGIYLEGSARIGRMNNDYHSDDIGISSINYDNSATYYAMHMGAGKVVKLSDRRALDMYGKLFYTHQNGSSATLNTGHIYDFDAIDSVRTRLGCRYTFGLDDTSSFYAGLAWQHEFGGTANATIHAGIYAASVPSPSVKGDTGILELGWNTTPANNNLELSLGLEACTGKQQGIGVNASILWHF